MSRAFSLAGFVDRKLWLAVAALAAVSSVAEAVGALLIFGLLGIATSSENTLELPLIGDLSDVLGVSGPDLLIAAAGLTVVFFIVRSLLAVGLAYTENRLSENAGVGMADHLLRGYLGAPYEWHLERNSSELIRNAHETVNVISRHVLLPSVRILSESLLTVAIFAVLVTTSRLPTLVAAAVLGAAIGGLLWYVHPRLRESGTVAQDMAKASIGQLQSTLEGLRDVRVLGREEHFRNEFKEVRQELADAKTLRATLMELPRVGIETLLIVFIAGFLIMAVVVGGSALETLPVLGLFGYSALRLRPSLNTIVQGVNSLRYATAAIDDAYDDITRVSAWDVSAREEAEPHAFQDRIEFRNVCFNYQGSAEYALRDIDLVIHKGDSVGIVGPTGGGKTTLVNVFLGLLRPSSGRVLVDGIDIHDDSRAWQRNLGVVSQTVFVTDGTIRENIALGIEEDEISEDAIWRSLTIAQLKDFVKSLPEGLNTRVGERGVRISGGQRQRVAIARALYRDPSVIVLDEGTSALDNATESQVLHRLQRFQGNRTILMVAHRLSTVQDCDLVALIENGRVAASGPYETLINQSPQFRRLAQ